ncbi:hypothetical protein GCM10012275_63150 [Longimycelium tulufanense]|uniref:Uncharacterized protein n=1 Tax=Longimycelium tulufanense TaxID=907463 RepID=A0A8J3CIW7_9PSEU|nr:hypothetical protein [Longimycelium tulufanense]GGM83896.1 hypothetical protein GCM10012275_63150 [Longimycelium tulufanense]
MAALTTSSGVAASSDTQHWTKVALPRPRQFLPQDRVGGHEHGLDLVDRLGVGLVTTDALASLNIRIRNAAG